MGTYGNIVFLIFLVLKLTGVVDWSWWLVCLPAVVAFIVNGVIFALARKGW